MVLFVVSHSLNRPDVHLTRFSFITVFKGPIGPDVEAEVFNCVATSCSIK